MSRVYSFRAENGFVPDGMETGVFVKKLVAGGRIQNSGSYASGIFSALVLVMPLVMILVAHNRALKRQTSSIAHNISSGNVPT